MYSARLLSALVGTLSVIFYCCHGYNVDVLSPLYIRSGLTDREQQEYLFGFSLERHRFSDGEQVLLVGAPKAYYNQLREGGVYVCELRDESICEMNSRFNLRNDSTTSVFDRLEGNIEEDINVDGQFLGYSIHSRGEHIIACAPHFIGTDRVGSDNLPTYTTNGRCILMPQDFDEFSSVQQLSTNVDDTLVNAGVDAKVYQQTNDGSDFFVVGAVRSGVDTPPRVGGVYVLTESTDRLVVAQKPETFSQNPDVAELRGYHIETGHFLQNISLGREDILASAPKAAEHRGQVYFYRTDGGVLEISGQISGGSRNGYFGYDFALVDLQTGGYHSLVVGCPLCDRERGQVFVYIHTQNLDNPVDEDNPTVINSPVPQQGRFGTAVENIGDIDQDGYEDIAVSAPYLGRGVVYVYRGTADGFILDDYQTIPGSNSTFGFGYVLEGDLDIDENYYPDFVIGSLTNSLSTYRSSPVVDVTISVKEEELVADFADKNCIFEGTSAICFTLTPCFNFSTLYGGVDKFAVQYTLTVDEESQRVGLFSDSLTNKITSNITMDNPEAQTCGPTYTFLVVTDSTRLEPVPFTLTIANVDPLLPLPSNDSADFGGELHPILRRGSERNTFQDQVLLFIANCGMDQVCQPEYDVDVTVDNGVTEIPWASAYEFSFTLSLTNRKEDSFVATMVINLPRGIRFSRSVSISDLAVSPCDSPIQQEVRCSLKDLILVDETVMFRVFFRPDVQNNTFDLQLLEFLFTVQDTVPRGQKTVTIPAKSVASYAFQSSFGVDTQQSFRFLPSFNSSAVSLDSHGPTINYQVSVRHTGLNNVSSPIPSLLINLVWPSVIRMAGGDSLPLLVPTRIIIIGSNDSFCRQYNAIPNHLLEPHQRSNLTLSNITTRPSTENCSEGVTCGVIQCKITNLSPQPVDGTAASPPVQISIFSTLWSLAVSDPIDINVHASVSSETEYPEIRGDIVSTIQNNIQLLPAVTETQRACFQLWIIIVSIVGGLMLAFVLVVVLGLCGCFGRSAYKKKKEDELRKKWKELQDTDGSLGARVIPPPSVTYSEEVPKPKEKEAEDELDTGGPDIPGTFAPYPESAHNDNGEITDETVMRLEGTMQLTEAAAANNDLETEI